MLIPLVLAAAAVACLVLASLGLRSLGPRYRVGRLLAAAPEVPLSEAVAMAGVGPPRYVRTTGRISSDEVFPDEHDRPLVYRRTRVEVAAEAQARNRSPRRGTPDAAWQVLSDDREAVAFGIEARSEFIAIDGAALADGLVVIPRESTGKAADLPDSLAAGRDPAAPTRLVIEQVSAVEHAIVAGVPLRGADGEPVITAGMGRPLILSTLERPAAMRILAGDRRPTVMAVAGLLGAGILLLTAALVSLLAAG